MEIEKIEAKPKGFKDYYQDPDFKKKHLEYIMTKVNCPECNHSYSRCNLAKHKQSKKHQKRVVVGKEVKLTKFQEAFLQFMKNYQE